MDGTKILVNVPQLHHLFAGGCEPMGCLSERRTGHKVNVLFQSKASSQHPWQGTITEEVCQWKLKKGQSFTQILVAVITCYITHVSHSLTSLGLLVFCIWALLLSAEHHCCTLGFPVPGRSSSHRWGRTFPTETAKVFTDVVVKVWVAMEEGEGTLVTGCHWTLCFSFSSFINEELSC